MPSSARAISPRTAVSSGPLSRPIVQDAFVEKYDILKATLPEGAVILFMDAAHPQHNPVLACGWIKHGKRHLIQRNTGRARLNMNGALNLEQLALTYGFDETIDAVSTIALFQQIEQTYPDAPRIIVFCDKARYDKSKAVAEFLETSRIHLEPLPPYTPNLNLIEGLWKFFNKQVLYNRNYERFADFRALFIILATAVRLRPASGRRFSAGTCGGVAVAAARARAGGGSRTARGVSARRSARRRSSRRRDGCGNCARP